MQEKIKGYKARRKAGLCVRNGCDRLPRRNKRGIVRAYCDHHNEQARTAYETWKLRNGKTPTVRRAASKKESSNDHRSSWHKATVGAAKEKILALYESPSASVAGQVEAILNTMGQRFGKRYSDARKTGRAGITAWHREQIEEIKGVVLPLFEDGTKHAARVETLLDEMGTQFGEHYGSMKAREGGKRASAASIKPQAEPMKAPVFDRRMLALREIVRKTTNEYRQLPPRGRDSWGKELLQVMAAALGQPAQRVEPIAIPDYVFVRRPITAMAA